MWRWWTVLLAGGAATGILAAFAAVSRVPATGRNPLLTPNTELGRGLATIQPATNPTSPDGKATARRAAAGSTCLAHYLDGVAAGTRSDRVYEEMTATAESQVNFRWRDAADQLYSEQYRLSYDYSQATVELTWDSAGSLLAGTISATDLKPNFTYQLKLLGLPGTPSNELIGLTGRWWQEE
jgi:hypothetical protein